MRSTILGNRGHQEGRLPPDACGTSSGGPHDAALELPPVPPVGGEGGSRRFVERVVSELSCTLAVIVSMLPRGLLAVTIAATPMPRDSLRPSLTAGPKGDRASWRLLTARRPMRVADPRTADDARRCVPAGLRGLAPDAGRGELAVAPLSGAVFPGFPAAVLAWRDIAGGGPGWDESSLRELGALCRAFERERLKVAGDAALAVARAAAGQNPTTALPAAPSGAGRTLVEAAALVQRLAPFRGVAVFDRAGRLLFPTSPGETPAVPGMPSLPDAALRAEMSEFAQALTQCTESAKPVTRWLGRSEGGVLVPFRVLCVATGPEADGAEVWFIRTPLPSEYAAVQPGDIPEDADAARLLPVLGYVSARFAQLPTLNEVAQRAHLSPFHFHRKFTEALGVTPKQFLLDAQIEHAQRELLLDEKPLARVAAACGFSHQSHFASRFKQATGLTPIQWRKRVAALA